MVTFNEFPSSNLVPGTYVEPDGSRALGIQPGELHRTLLVAIMSAGGTATPGVVVPVSGEGEGEALFGDKSMAADMARAYKRIDRTSRLYVLPVLENGAGTAATGTLVLAGTATKDGTLTSRIGDRRVSTSVLSGMTAAQAATAHAASINATPRAPVSAAAATATITLTARHKGESGNALTYEVELLPAGITATPTLATPTSLATGTTNPVLSTPLSALDDLRYDTFCTGITDAANVALLEAEAERRWRPTVKRYAHVIGAVSGTLGTVSTYGQARNSRFSSIVDAGKSPSAPWVVAAQAAAWDAVTCNSMPNRPRNGLPLLDVEAPKQVDRRDHDERQGLLGDGISTLKVDSSGRVMIERLVTTYKTSASGTPDATYRSIETVRNLASLLIEWLGLGTRHERDVLGPDGKNYGAGTPIVTPKLMRGELVALYRSRERRALVKDTDGFAADLVVEINGTDPERLDIHAAPRLVNGLVTTAIKVSFQL